MTTLRTSATYKLKAMMIALLLIATQSNTFAQQHTTHTANSGEDYGNTLNLGIGIGYYGYLYNSVPFFFADYEFNVAPQFTLAPFIGVASFRSDAYYYGGNGYYYHETVIPIGVKGTYYFDRLLDLNPNWDIYAAASLGVTYDHRTWDDGYRGDESSVRTASALYIDLHAGAEYHFNRRLGIFLDLSTGVSTIGIAIHHR